LLTKKSDFVSGIEYDASVLATTGGTGNTSLSSPFWLDCTINDRQKLIQKVTLQLPAL